MENKFFANKALPTKLWCTQKSFDKTASSLCITTYGKEDKSITFCRKCSTKVIKNMFKHGYLKEPTTFHFKNWLTEGFYFKYFCNCLITLGYLFKVGCNYTLLFLVTAFGTT